MDLLARLDSHDAATFAGRRARLAGLLGDAPALLAAGAPSPRNYPANTYPHRASSHFLYLFGLPLRSAYALLSADGWTVYAPQPEPNGALWHGPEPTLEQLADALGCPARPLTELETALGELRARGATVMTLAAPDAGTCARQSALVGRPIACGTVAEPDRPLAEAMVALRLRHDEAARGELRLAAQATAAAHAAGLRATRAGVREAAVRAAMESELIARDLTVAYGSIVTTHGEVLHNEAHHHLLCDGDLLLCDVGAESPGGFAGDVTRTWPVSGRFSATQRALYDVVLAAQEDTVRRVRPGVNYRDLHLHATERLGDGLVQLGILKGAQLCGLIEQGAVALFFPHGVGHLLGLDVHDMEDLGDLAGYRKGASRSRAFGLRSLRLDRVLEPGMAVTIEPGLYQVPAILEHPELGRDPALHALVDWEVLARFADVRGIRIEDDVLVTADGHEVLTAAIPKQPADIEAAVGRGFTVPA